MRSVVRIVSQFFAGKEARRIEANRQRLAMGSRQSRVMALAHLDANAYPKTAKRLFNVCHSIQTTVIEVEAIADLPPLAGLQEETRKETQECNLHCQRLERLLSDLLAEVRILAVRYRPVCQVRIIDPRLIEPPIEAVNTDWQSIAKGATNEAPKDQPASDCRLCSDVSNAVHP